MALILGIDRFLSMCRAVVNMIGNAVATLVIARWEKELDRSALRRHLLEGMAENGSSQVD
jgi:aerobic C4-dicarboxylate transport protein